MKALKVEADQIVDDYLGTVRNAGLSAGATDRENDEAEREAICQAHGTTTGGAFRAAVESVDLDAVLRAAHWGADDRQAFLSWRGAVEAR